MNVHSVQTPRLKHLLSQDLQQCPCSAIRVWRHPPTIPSQGCRHRRATAFRSTPKWWRPPWVTRTHPFSRSQSHSPSPIWRRWGAKALPLYPIIMVYVNVAVSNLLHMLICCNIFQDLCRHLSEPALLVLGWSLCEVSWSNIVFLPLFYGNYECCFPVRWRELHLCVLGWVGRRDLVWSRLFPGAVQCHPHCVLLLPSQQFCCSYGSLWVQGEGDFSLSLAVLLL